MLRELIVDDDDKINLVYGLYKLFSEIDFNGDGSMQWEEFTQFIIDSVMGENKTKDNEDEEGSGKDLSEKQLKKYEKSISEIKEKETGEDIWNKFVDHTSKEFFTDDNE